jgi:hypothetical protein
MTAKRIGGIVAALLILGLACGALSLHWFDATYNAPPRIEVVNDSDLVLEDLVVEGTGFRLQIDRLPPHSKTMAVVHVGGESGLKVSFKAGPKVYSDDDLAYLEEQGGYSVVVTIDESLAIHARQRLMRFY